MKVAVKRLIRDEKGAALVLTLVLLLVGGLIVAPLLGFMGTGIIAGEVHEKRMDELYAADAGVEDALWRIQNGAVNLTVCYDELSYNITDADGGVAEVNDKHVEVTITLISVWEDIPCDYKIVSKATGDGSGTEVEAYISGTVTYCSIMDHLVTVQEDLTPQQVEDLERDLGKLGIPCPTECTECEKCGKAYDYNSDAYKSIPQECKGCIAVYNFPGAGWPTVSDLSARYWENVKNETPYPSDTIDLASGDMEKGPLYRDSGLDIKNSSNTPFTLTLTGPIYIRGDTRICYNVPGNRDMTLDLNGHTIFVASNSTGAGNEALQLGDRCTIKGPGVIIAVGDIYFKPNGQAGANEEPVFVLSVLGTTRVQPNIDFLGAIAGKLDVNIQSGNADVSYPTGGFGPVNFPSLFEAKRSYSIYSWEIIQLSPGA